VLNYGLTTNWEGVLSYGLPTLREGTRRVNVGCLFSPLRGPTERRVLWFTPVGFIKFGLRQRVPKGLFILPEGDVISPKGGCNFNPKGVFLKMAEGQCIS